VAQRSSCQSVVKVVDLCPASLGSILTGTHISHWQGHPAKIAPVHQ